MDQDLELINRFKNGDSGGFEMLVKKYHNRVINIVYSLTRNKTDAEDIAQEVFLKIYFELDNFKAQAKFSSWFYRITVNSTYDFLRRQKHRLASLEDNDYTNIPDKTKTPDILAQELIQEALKNIPFEFRCAIILREIEGLSYEEISQALKISLGTVESRIYRAREMLKNILIQKGVTNEM